MNTALSVVTWQPCVFVFIFATFLLDHQNHVAADQLLLPSQSEPMMLAVDLPDGSEFNIGQNVALIELDGESDKEFGTKIAAQIVPAMTADGKPAEQGRLLAVIPPREDQKDAPETRRFLLKPGDSSADLFQLEQPSDTTTKLRQGDQSVLAYNFGTIVGEQVPASDHRRSRACYIHPLWGLHGEVLTDDFPRDHYHHHGIFWTWPHIGIEGRTYDSWAGNNIELRMNQWLQQTTGPVAGVLAIENGWYIDPDFSRQVMAERVWIRVYKAVAGSRAIDLEFTWVPTDVPVTLWGAGGKSYGGLTVRFIGTPHKDQVITVPSGPTSEDLPMTPLKWADFTRHFQDAPGRSGATVMVHPEHPDYPPTWLTRHYGPLCVGWPGVEPQTFEPGKPIRLAYRIWIHADDADTQTIQRAYDAYTTSAKAHWADSVDVSLRGQSQ